MSHKRHRCTSMTFYAFIHIFPCFCDCRRDAGYQMHPRVSMMERNA